MFLSVTFETLGYQFSYLAHVHICFVMFSRILLYVFLCLSCFIIPMNDLIFMTQFYVWLNSFINCWCPSWLHLTFLWCQKGEIVYKTYSLWFSSLICLFDQFIHYSSQFLVCLSMLYFWGRTWMLLSYLGGINITFYD